MRNFLKKITGAEAREREWDNTPHPIPDQFKDLLLSQDRFVYGHMYVDYERKYLRFYRAAIYVEDKKKWDIYVVRLNMKKSPLITDVFHSNEPILCPFDDYERYTYDPWIVDSPREVISALNYDEPEYERLLTSSENFSSFALRHGYRCEGGSSDKLTVSNIQTHKSVLVGENIENAFTEAANKKLKEILQWCDIPLCLTQRSKKTPIFETYKERHFRDAHLFLKQLEFFTSRTDEKDILELRSSMKLFAIRDTDLPGGEIKDAYRKSVVLGLMNLSATCVQLLYRGDLSESGNLITYSQELADQAMYLAREWHGVYTSECAQMKDVILTGPNPDQVLPLRRLIMERGADQYPPAPPPPSP